MTISAMDALTLDRCLQEQRQLAKTVANAWLVSSSEDLRWPGVALQGARPAPGLGLMRRYMDLVLYSAVEDLQITQEYLGVLGMVNAPLSLARPWTVARVFWSALKRTVRRLSVHEHEPSFALSAKALKQLHALPPMCYEQVS